MLTTHTVIAAIGHFQQPRTPKRAGDLTIPHLHSAHYRKPGDVAGARVLVAGGGNSGSQIAEEFAHHGRTVSWDDWPARQ